MNKLPSHIEDITETPTNPETILTDEQLSAGGLVPVKAFMRSKASANALRVKKHREKSEGEGIKQINVQAPEEAREVIKEIAERTKAGETTQQVLALLANKETTSSETLRLAEIGKKVMALSGWRRQIAHLIGLL